MQLERRTEINIELTRRWLVHRPATPSERAACATQGEMVAPPADVLLNVTTRTLSDSSEANQSYFIENADSGEAIEIESAEGQLILAAAVRSLEQRLSPEARTTICAGQDTLILNGTKRNVLYRKLQSFYRFTCLKALRFARKEK